MRAGRGDASGSIYEFTIFTLPPNDLSECARVAVGGGALENNVPQLDF